MRHPCILGLLGLTLGAAAPAPPAPLKWGQSIDQLRTAMPETAWQDGRLSTRSGKALSVRAAAAIPLAGAAFDAEVTPGYHGAYHIRLSRTAPAGEDAACLGEAMALTDALEPLYGALTPPPHTQPKITYGPMPVASQPAGAEQEPPGADSAARPGDRIVKASGQSRLHVHEPGAGARMVVQAERRDGDFLLALKATMEPAGEGGGITCLLAASLALNPAIPAPEVIALDPARLLKEPGLGFKHHSLDGLPPLEADVTVLLLCTVSRMSGTVQSCDLESADPVAARYRSVATRRARAMVFDTAGWDADDPQPLKIQIPVVLAVADRQAPDLESTVLTPLGEVVFAPRPAGWSLDAYYPAEFLRKGIGREVSVRCRVMADDSLICASAENIASVAVEEVRAALLFGRAAASAMGALSVAPVLKSGAPSAGAMFEVTVAFRIEE